MEYLEKMSLFRRLESGLKERLREVDRRAFAREFADNVGITESTATGYISQGINGQLKRRISPESQADHRLHLERLATLYRMLGIAEDDSLVRLVRSINPSFTYEQ